MSDLHRKIEQTVGYLWMTAIEMRRIAEHQAYIAGAFHRIADQLEAEVAELKQATGRPVLSKQAIPLIWLNEP